MELPGYLNRFDFDGGSTGRNKSNWSGSDGKFHFRSMVFLIRNSKTSFSDISAWFEMTDIINNIKLDIFNFLNFSKIFEFLILKLIGIFYWKHHKVWSNIVFQMIYQPLTRSKSIKIKCKGVYWMATLLLPQKIFTGKISLSNIQAGS